MSLDVLTLAAAKKYTDSQLMGGNGYITPEMYGAIGDGMTDDTAAIAEAISTGKPVLFVGNYAVKKQIHIPMNYNLSCNGATFNLSGEGCFVLGKNSALKDANIHYNGNGSAILITERFVDILNCYVWGEGASGYGVSFDNANGIAYVAIKDCKFYNMACAVYVHSSSWVNSLALDYSSVSCKQAFDGKCSGSCITVNGQGAKLNVNNNEVHQIVLEGELNRIDEKIYDVGNSDSCSLGLLVTGRMNVVDSFSVFLKNASSDVIGSNNTVLNHGCGIGDISVTDFGFAADNWASKVRQDTISVNTELTTADSTFSNNILNNVMLHGGTFANSYAYSSVSNGQKAVFDIIPGGRISVLEHLCFSFGSLYEGLKSIKATLISADSAVENIELSTRNINRCTVLWGNTGTRALYSKNYTTLRIEFEFNSGTIEFTGVGGMFM